jgi:hypothetical protein
MRRLTRLVESLAVLATFAIGATASLAQGGTKTEVDLNLVLAVDVSWSMDPEEQRLQRDGYVGAFRDPQVIKAIRSGPQQRIAVTYFEWAGPDIHFMVIPWMIVDGPAAAHRLADELSKREISRHRMTSISSALQYADRQLSASPFRAQRSVIDVSGDGPNNSGLSPVTLVRDELLAKGVIINGLPITLKAGQYSGFGWGQDIGDLDAYYGNCVIGGPGSFMIPIKQLDEFTTATRQKLLLEISGLDQPRIRRVQDTGPGPAARAGKGASPQYDCLVGERNWRRRFRDWDRF